MAGSKDYSLGERCPILPADSNKTLSFSYFLCLLSLLTSPDLEDGTPPRLSRNKQNLSYYQRKYRPEKQRPKDHPVRRPFPLVSEVMSTNISEPYKAYCEVSSSSSALFKQLSSFYPYVLSLSIYSLNTRPKVITNSAYGQVHDSFFNDAFFIHNDDFHGFLSKSLSLDLQLMDHGCPCLAGSSEPQLPLLGMLPQPHHYPYHPQHYPEYFALPSVGDFDRLTPTLEDLPTPSMYSVDDYPFGSL